MALFKSQVLTQASGSVGGLTYSHAAGGMYMRARAFPVNPNTTFQQQVKSALTALVVRWTETLTPTQRASWNLYAANTPTTNALGDTIFLSGQNWYIASNTPRQQVNTKLLLVPALATIDTAPVIFDRGDFTTPAIAALNEGASLEFSFTSADLWDNEPGSALLVYMGRPRNPGRNFFAGPFRLIGALQGAVVPPTSPFIISETAATTRGFVYSEGQLVTFAFSVTRIDGRLSTRRLVTGTVEP